MLTETFSTNNAARPINNKIKIKVHVCLNSPLFYCLHQDTPFLLVPPISGRTWKPRDRQNQQSGSRTRWHRRTGFWRGRHQWNPENVKLRQIMIIFMFMLLFWVATRIGLHALVLKKDISLFTLSLTPSMLWLVGSHTPEPAQLTISPGGYVTFSASS